MEIEVKRLYKKPGYTIGKMYVNGEFFSDTLEDMDRGLTKEMSLSKINRIKVLGETAIPTGKYEVRMTYSVKFADRSWALPTQGDVPLIVDVPGFTGVRIHPFNRASESLGCISVGKNDARGWLSRTAETYRRLVDEHILPALKAKEKVNLTIE